MLGKQPSRQQSFILHVSIVQLISQQHLTITSTAQVYFFAEFCTKFGNSQSSCREHLMVFGLILSIDNLDEIGLNHLKIVVNLNFLH